MASEQYIGTDAVEFLKHLAGTQSRRQMPSCEGRITSVDPVTYMAKVMLEPWGVETGWLPIGTMAAGAGWGVFHLPPDDTEVTVDFVGGEINNGRIRCCYPNDTDAPPEGLKQGEFLLQHESGTLLRFDADGNLLVTTDKDLKVQVGGDLTAAVDGDLIADIAGAASVSADSLDVRCDVTIQGTLDVSGETTIQGKDFSTHQHSGVQTGAGATGPVA